VDLISPGEVCQWNGYYKSTVDLIPTLGNQNSLEYFIRMVFGENIENYT
jgi:hypothetical protein